MKTILLMLFLPLLADHSTGESYLQKIGPYQRDSYYRAKVYDEHDWKTFYQLKEPNTAVQSNNYDMHLLSACVFYATNKLRAEKKLGPLQFSGALRDAATVHTWQMVEDNFLNHFNPKNSALHSPLDRLNLFDVHTHEVGENIDLTTYYTSGKTTYIQLAEIIVKELYDSPPHRKALLSESFGKLGCASIFDTHYKGTECPVRTTQDFSTVR